MLELEKIEEKEFWELFWNPNLQIIEVLWRKPSNSKDMSSEEFQEYLLHFVELSKKFKIIGFLTNTQKYHVPIPPDLQEWHDQTIIPEYVELGIKKIAFLVSEEDLITFLSLEQTFEEEQAKVIDTRFFDSLEKARLFFKTIS